MDHFKDNAASRKAAEMIANVRKEQGVSIRKLAEMMDIAPSTISRWERNDTLVTGEMVNRVYKALNVEQPYEQDAKISEESQKIPLVYYWQGRAGGLLVLDADKDRSRNLPRKYSVKMSVFAHNIPDSSILYMNCDMFVRDKDIVHATVMFKNGFALEGLWTFKVKNEGVTLVVCDDTEEEEPYFDDGLRDDYTYIDFKSREMFEEMVVIHSVLEGYYVNVR